jgi:hypothetical protein
MALDDGQVGFTSEDRKLLITLAANFQNLKESTERRITLLESERAHKDDLTRIERDLRATISAKADRVEIPSVTVARLEKACEDQENLIRELGRKITYAYAFGAGGSFATGAIVYFVTMFLRRG